MDELFACPVLYHDKTIDRKNWCHQKIPIALVVKVDKLAPFALSLIEPDGKMTIEQAERYAQNYQTAGTHIGDWEMLENYQIQALAAMARDVQGTLIALGDFAKKLNWGFYYLSARHEKGLRYIDTVGIPCGKIFLLYSEGTDFVRVTIKNFEQWICDNKNPPYRW